MLTRALLYTAFLAFPTDNDGNDATQRTHGMSWTASSSVTDIADLSGVTMSASASAVPVEHETGYGPGGPYGRCFDCHGPYGELLATGSDIGPGGELFDLRAHIAQGASRESR